MHVPFCPQIASGANKINCTVYDKFKSAQRHMEKQFKEAEEEDWKQPLSVLFNAFIMMQVNKAFSDVRGQMGPSGGGFGVSWPWTRTGSERTSR